jgi:DNA polymerase-3 subunit epsilon
MVMNAPKFYEIARHVVELTANKIFVAHNVNFDYNFIKQEFKELGYNYNRKKICTVEMSRKYLPGFKSYSLGKICANLGITINDRHRAGGDALATVELFSLLLKKHHTLNKSLF